MRICARESCETFITKPIGNHQQVRIVNSENQKDHVRIPVAAHKPITIPKTKTPSEKVVLKFGKISVQVKNAEQVKVCEEDGMLLIKAIPYK